MVFAASSLILSLILLTLFLVGGIALQVFLASRNSRWLGLILPGIVLVYSLLGVFGMIGYGDTGMFSLLMQVLWVFALMNLPNAVLLPIYFHYRRKRRQQSDLDRMRMQDL